MLCHLFAVTLSVPPATEELHFSVQILHFSGCYFTHFDFWQTSASTACSDMCSVGTILSSWLPKEFLYIWTKLVQHATLSGFHLSTDFVYSFNQIAIHREWQGVSKFLQLQVCQQLSSHPGQYLWPPADKDGLVSLYCVAWARCHCLTSIHSSIRPAVLVFLWICK